jgi:LysR family transcriptional regulator, nitrogen assimilation regulatory protein
MQFRQLRYFVKIVDAGSFSRAAAVVHVAQPALSQQIAELEARFGVSLLQRSARGVRTTAAGEILYKEASAILQQLDRLPSIIQPNQGEPEGTVGIGLVHSLTAKVLGGILDACRMALPKVIVRVLDHDRAGLEDAIRLGSLDLAVCYEDDSPPTVSRKPLFTHKLYLVSRDETPGMEAITLEQVARLPLVLPGPASTRRALIERKFSEADLKPNVVVEAESLAAAMWVVQRGGTYSIVAMGDMSHFGPGVFAKPLPIEPEIALVCSIVRSADFPLSHAAQAVHDLIINFIRERIRQPDMPGTRWIA